MKINVVIKFTLTLLLTGVALLSSPTYAGCNNPFGCEKSNPTTKWSVEPTTQPPAPEAPQKK